jgi:hypothetical protein
MHVIEVVARFEATVLATVDLHPGARYRAGTGRGDDLAVELGSSIAIVEGDIVRAPPEATAIVYQHGKRSPLTGELRLDGHMRVEIRIGRVTIAIRRATRVEPVPRPSLDRRPYIYIAASLAAQVLLVALAAWIAPARDPPRPAHTPRPTRVARFPEPRPATKQDPSPVPAAATAPTDPSTAPPPADKTPDLRRSRRSRAIARAREAGILGSDGVSDLSGLVASDIGKAFDGVRPAYREEEATARGFGGGERWDPGGVVPMGRFATKSNAGADYELAGATAGPKTVLKTCTGRPCATTGPHTRETVVAIVDERAEALLECHERYAGRNVRGFVTLDFDIDRDGAVLRPTSAGMGELAGCAMRVVQGIAFPIAPGDAQTEVKLSLEFTDSGSANL